MIEGVVLAEKGSPNIDMRRLAELMLRWEVERAALDALEAEVKDIVLALGESQTVGYVRATYTKGRTTYDYELACRDEAEKDPELVAKHAKTTVDWRAMALESLGLSQAEIPVDKVGSPSVSIKMLK